MNAARRYTLSDLARACGVTPRTVRYYIAQGLLPGPHDAGRGAWYDERHLARLRLIRELGRQHLPLAQIRSTLAGLADEDVATALEEWHASSAIEAAAESPRASALDAVRSMLGLSPAGASGPARAMFVLPVGRSVGSIAPTVPTVPTAPPEPASPERSAPTMVVGSIVDLGPAALNDAGRPPAEQRSQWDRIALTPDIELHVRRPLSRRDSKKVERLIAMAREVLADETSTPAP